jgi:hypothetical protein
LPSGGEGAICTPGEDCVTIGYTSTGEAIEKLDLALA